MFIIYLPPISIAFLRLKVYGHNRKKENKAEKKETDRKIQKKDMERET